MNGQANAFAILKTSCHIFEIQIGRKQGFTVQTVLVKEFFPSKCARSTDIVDIVCCAAIITQAGV